MWCKKMWKTQDLDNDKNWTSGKTKKLKFLQNLNYSTNQRVRYWQNSKTYVSYLKILNPNLDKTQEIKSRKKRKKFDKKSLN